MQEVESLKNVMRQGVTTLCFSKRLSWPALAILKSSIEFSQASYELCLLLLEHLNIALGIDLVLRLLPLPKDADGIVGLTPAAWASAITL